MRYPNVQRILSTQLEARTCRGDNLNARRLRRRHDRLALIGRRVIQVGRKPLILDIRFTSVKQGHRQEMPIHLVIADVRVLEASDSILDTLSTQRQCSVRKLAGAGYALELRYLLRFLTNEL